MTTSVYIHIPFCKQICSYCDFPKQYYHLSNKEEYLLSLEQEIEKYYQKEPIKTLYIGGGTPSSLNKEELTKLFTIIKKLDLTKLEEFTFECNIEDITEELLQTLTTNKVNRLSIGIQTTNKDLLKYLNRVEVDYEEKLSLLKKHNITNYNFDFIYAIKNQSIKDIKKDISLISKYQPTHISFYSLIIEDHTVLQHEEEIEETLYLEMTSYINKRLKELGYNHYEISNYAKSNYESKHNLVYWNNQEYYGFGLGASSYLNNQRITNTKSMKKYLQGSYRYTTDVLTDEDKMSYEMILGLRKLSGVNKKEFIQKYQKTIEEVFVYNKISELIEEDDTYIKIKEDKLSLSNEVLLMFIKE